MGELGKYCAAIEDWHQVLGYIILAFALSLVVRGSISLHRAWEISHLTGTSFSKAWCCSFWGSFPKPIKDGKQDKHSDYWAPFVLGWIELLAYPIFMALNAWTVIGAWIGLKTLAQWNAWTENRNPFNRYLIGNALIVSFAAIFLTDFMAMRKFEAGHEGRIICVSVSEKFDGRVMG